MKNLPYCWLKPAWQQLQGLRERLPHALLIYGPQGIGKRDLAEHFAQSLLCETLAEDGHPCGECPGCRWFGDGNHPDFRAVLPEILQPEPDLEAGDSSEAADEPSAGKAKRAPSKVIKIGQIRGLDGFFNVGTHRAGRRVVVIYPADTLNTDAGNALLKTLEEPPPLTVFLLVTGHPSDVLPTIRSRCAKFPVSRPPVAEMIGWLSSHGVKDPEHALAEAGGAPLLAVAEDPAAGYRDILVGALAAGTPIDPVTLAEKCEKAGGAKLALWLTRWVSDLILVGASGDVRYHPGHKRALAALAAQPGRSTALLEFYRHLMRVRRVAEHPLNPRLFAEDLLIDYARLTAPAR